MNSPYITVITIVYNGENYIENAIKSVISQDYPNKEYIIIDGGSTDNTLGIIDRYRPQINKTISEKDKGIADAFNKGIRLATGDIIGFVNADDFLENNILQLIAKNYKENTVLYGDVRFWMNSTSNGHTKSDHQRLRHGMTVAHPSVYIPKHIYEKYGLYNTAYAVAMDYDLLLRLFMNHVEFRNIHAIVSNMNETGLSNKKWFKGIIEEYKIKNEYFNPIANFYFFIKQFMYLFIKSILRKFK